MGGRAILEILVHHESFGTVHALTARMIESSVVPCRSIAAVQHSFQASKVIAIAARSQAQGTEQRIIKAQKLRGIHNFIAYTVESRASLRELVRAELPRILD